uniref:Uncharacterized protein n=1 Tax=Anguilla anguilla TaxID=7936 RepID=A0A0E9RXZ4_ANGAN
MQALSPIIQDTLANYLSTLKCWFSCSLHCSKIFHLRHRNTLQLFHD